MYIIYDNKLNLRKFFSDLLKITKTRTLIFVGYQSL